MGQTKTAGHRLAAESSSLQLLGEGRKQIAGHRLAIESSSDQLLTKYTTTRGLVISIRISARFESSLDNTESSVIVIYG